MGATSYIRSLGVPCSQYIDDRHVGQLTTCRKSPKSTTAWSDFELAEAFFAAAVLISLGYFIGLAKSSLLPKRIVKFLGFLVDSQRFAFILPEDKKHKFAALRESILDKKSSSVKTLQRLPGKITSFCIAVPAAQIYCREIFKATAGYTKSARPVKIHSLLREEIEHWRFLDSWEGTLPWPSERHIVLEILSDASDYAWGELSDPLGPHFWTASTRLSPIVVKEALALVNVLSAGEHLISNARVDAYTDNTAFIHSWGKQGGKTQSSTPLSNRSTIFHCAVTLTSSCITLRPPTTQLMYLPECSQIRIASSPFPHGARFSRFSVRIPLTLCLWIPMSSLMKRGYL